jgi:drug/metabolite transporter (DMT)-like permease
MQYALLFLLFQAISIFLFQELLKNINAKVLAVVEVVIAMAAMLLCTLFIDNISLKNVFVSVSFNWYLLIFISGFCTFIAANYYSFIIIKTESAASNSLIAPLITVFTVVFCTVFFNEPLTKVQLTGCIVSIGGVLMYHWHSLKNINGKAIVNKLICALFAASGIVITVYLLKQTNIASYHFLFLRIFAIGVCSVIGLLVYKKPLHFLHKKWTLVLLISTVTIQYVITNFFWIKATRALKTIEFQTIIVLLPFVVALLTYLFNTKLKPTVQFYVAAAIATVGIVLFFV